MSQTKKHCEPLVAAWLRPSTTEPCICCKQVAEKPRGEHLKNDVCPVRLDGLIKFSHQRVWLIVYLASLCTHSNIYFHKQTSEYCLFLLKSILFDHKSK